VLHEEYQGGATTTLVIHHAKVEDAGTYSLQATNRNGTEKVDLDLIVLDTLPDCECLLLKVLKQNCSCQHSYTGPDGVLQKAAEMQMEIEAASRY